MTLQGARFGLLAILFALCSACLTAQDGASSGSAKPPADAVTQLNQQVHQLTTQVEQLQKELADLKARRPASGTTTTTAAAVPAGKTDYVTRTEFEALQAKVQAHTDLIASVDGKLAGMEKNAREFAAQVQEQNALQGQMLAAISTTGDAGNTIPNLHAVMSDPQGRATLEDAVHQVLRRKGTVTIENHMGQSYTMRVNGQTHIVPAGGSTVIQDVPVGNVATELVGYEEPKVLALAPPTYEAKILIQPQQRQVVRRVASLEEIVPQATVPTLPIVTPMQYTYYDPLLGWVVVP